LPGAFPEVLKGTAEWSARWRQHDAAGVLNASPTGWRSASATPSRDVRKLRGAVLVLLAPASAERRQVIEDARSYSSEQTGKP
jgi:hypothetical protein